MQIDSAYVFLVDLELQNKNERVAHKESKPIIPIIVIRTHLMMSQISSLPKIVKTEKVSRQTVSKPIISFTHAGICGGRAFGI